MSALTIQGAKIYGAEIRIGAGEPAPSFVACSFFNCRISVDESSRETYFQNCLFHGCSHENLQTASMNCLFDDNYSLAL
ncbi:hypothetical protein [Thermithiobacillus plumbiphilus]|uniref:Pentapeptide repeat-containing protein n=1 Tax=Thermithiobacillus plumbiphilus TaxID=1729899 RepID=A0ABU9D6Y3_9PROT